MALSIGVDLAQARDATAIVAVESYSAAEPTESRRVRRSRHHQIVYVAKLKRGLSYPAQAQLIAETAESLEAESRPSLWLDATGVGRAVVDLVRQATRLPVRAVTLTSAADTVSHGKDLSVPKAELVATLEVALSTRRIHCGDLPLAKDLATELRAFSYELSGSGRPMYGGSGEHDDLVIALSLAVFAGERGGSAETFFDAMRDLDERSRRNNPPTEGE